MAVVYRTIKCVSPLSQPTQHLIMEISPSRLLQISCSHNSANAWITEGGGWVRVWDRGGHSSPSNAKNTKIEDAAPKHLSSS
ncbi:hypothetical protein F2P79_016069 [Pimephales promelas]|nr:hypothetical protein F2P79_016069 [Pimephales promelas]